RGQFSSDRWPTGVEMRGELFDDCVFDPCSFVTCVHLLLQSVMPSLQRRHVCEGELCIDHLDVTDGINRSAHMMNVRIFEAAHDLYNRVHFPNVMEKLVSQAFARACSFHQAGDIDELNRGWCDFLRVG